MIGYVRLAGVATVAAVVFGASQFTTTDKASLSWTAKSDAPATAVESKTARASTGAVPELRGVRQIALAPTSPRPVSPAVSAPLSCEDQVWPNIAPDCLTRETAAAGRKEARLAAPAVTAKEPVTTTALVEVAAADPVATGSLPLGTLDAQRQVEAVPAVASQRARPARRASRERPAPDYRRYEPAMAYASLPAERSPTPRQPIQFSLADRGN